MILAYRFVVMFGSMCVLVGCMSKPLTEASVSQHRASAPSADKVKRIPIYVKLPDQTPPNDIKIVAQFLNDYFVVFTQQSRFVAAYPYRQATRYDRYADREPLYQPAPDQTLYPVELFDSLLVLTTARTSSTFAQLQFFDLKSLQTVLGEQWYYAPNLWQQSGPKRLIFKRIGSRLTRSQKLQLVDAPTQSATGHSTIYYQAYELDLGTRQVSQSNLIVAG